MRTKRRTAMRIGKILNTPLVLFIVAFTMVVAATSVAQVGGIRQPLMGGANDVNTPEANAVVRLSMGCTGTLIASDLVLTAGHCIAITPDPPSSTTTRFNRYNWEFPGAWYGMQVPIEIIVGNDRSGVTATSSRVGFSETFTLTDKSGSQLESGHSVNLKTSGGFFLVAEGGGGIFVGSDRTLPSTWETFVVRKTSGAGPIRDGDTVTLQANNGQYVVAAGGGGGEVNATSNRVGPSETFTIRRIAGSGPVQSGDAIALQASNRQYVVAAGGGGGGFRSRVLSYSIAGFADIKLLRLHRHVPASVARPAEVLTRMPDSAVRDPAAFWRSQRYQMAGWGQTGGPVARYRQVAEGQNGQYPWTTFGRTTATQIRVQGVGGATILPGDSGGPLFWTDPGTRRKYLIAVTQGTEAAGGRYTVTFVRGGKDSKGDPMPNIGIWLEDKLGREDCIGFDYRSATVRRIDGRWKLVAEHVWLADFGSSESEAQAALRVVQGHRLTRVCYVERPNPPMTYFLTDGGAPTGTISGEDCLSFNPRNLEPKLQGGRWGLADGSLVLLSFGTDLEGDYNEAAFARTMINKYGFTNTCFVGRPNPSMMYFRR